MGNIYGTPMSAEEQRKKAQSIIGKSVVQLEMACEDSDERQKNLIREIKRDAKTHGDNVVVRAKAKQLVRMRNQRVKMMEVQFKMQSIGETLVTMSALQDVQVAMQSAARALHVLNQQINLQVVQKMMQQFERDTEIMEAKDELISDTLNEMGAQEEDQANEDTIVNQVLDELGVEIGGGLDGVTAAGKEFNERLDKLKSGK